MFAGSTQPTESTPPTYSQQTGYITDKKIEEIFNVISTKTGNLHDNYITRATLLKFLTDEKVGME